MAPMLLPPACEASSLYLDGLPRDGDYEELETAEYEGELETEFTEQDFCKLGEWDEYATRILTTATVRPGKRKAA